MGIGINSIRDPFITVRISSRFVCTLQRAARIISHTSLCQLNRLYWASDQICSNVYWAAPRQLGIRSRSCPIHCHVRPNTHSLSLKYFLYQDRQIIIHWCIASSYLRLTSLIAFLLHLSFSPTTDLHCIYICNLLLPLFDFKLKNLCVLTGSQWNLPKWRFDFSFYLCFNSFSYLAFFKVRSLYWFSQLGGTEVNLEPSTGSIMMLTRWDLPKTGPSVSHC